MFTGTTQAQAATAEPQKKRKARAKSKTKAKLTAESESGKTEGRRSLMKRKVQVAGTGGGPSAASSGTKAGSTQVHHLWISDWRKRTGGSLKDGRAAWKALGPEGKDAAKTTYLLTSHDTHAEP